MKYFDFLNETRISFKKMSVEEIVKNALENNKDNKRKTINYLKTYAKHNLEPNSEIYKKIEQAIILLNKDEKTPSKMNNIIKEVENILRIDTYNNFKKEIFLYHKNDLNERMQKADNETQQNFWKQILNLYISRYDKEKKNFIENVEKRKKQKEEERKNKYKSRTTSSSTNEKTKDLIRKM